MYLDIYMYLFIYIYTVFHLSLRIAVMLKPIVDTQDKEKETRYTTAEKYQFTKEDNKKGIK